MGYRCAVALRNFVYLTRDVMLYTQQNFLVQVICLPKKTTVTVLIFTLLLLLML